MILRTDVMQAVIQSIVAAADADLGVSQKRPTRSRIT